MTVPRKRGESGIYHVVARGTGRQLIFEDDDDRGMFLGLLRSELSRTQVELYAWCLMGNHVHLLLHAPLENISECMKRVLGSYAQRFNEKAGRTGHLFQERFKSEPIEGDEYLLTVLRYIHLNPDKARIARFDEYEWSSYSEYLGIDGLCNTSFVCGMFGSVEEYRRFHALSRDDDVLDVDKPRSATRTMPDLVAMKVAQSVLGNLSLTEIKALDRKNRDALLARLREAGLSIKQIERLTGIGRGIVARAKRVK